MRSADTQITSGYTQANAAASMLSVLAYCEGDQGSLAAIRSLQANLRFSKLGRDRNPLGDNLFVHTSRGAEPDDMGY